MQRLRRFLFLWLPHKSEKRFSFDINYFNLMINEICLDVSSIFFHLLVFVFPALRLADYILQPKIIYP